MSNIDRVQELTKLINSRMTECENPEAKSYG